jgi:predicted GNAT superfamily acetyltransferase
MELRYEQHPALPDEPQLTALVDLLALVFPNETSEATREKLRFQNAQAPVVTQLAFLDNQLVGCKLGYRRKPTHFYSWLGGVHPDFRQHGIATGLMEQQHGWCRGQGYKSIRTQTYNTWRPMLILNIKSGFDIIGTVQGKHGLTIVLEKHL